MNEEKNTVDMPVFVLQQVCMDAQTQLDDTRFALSDAAHSFAQHKQSIENHLTQGPRRTISFLHA